ncbi:GtrA family protein [Thauera mechernichensis]|uniref:GtrA family protein n=1 Tax=Thauera mechernichensis TaxID=82788 RepID=A0ABW3WFS0_9RHOO
MNTLKEFKCYILTGISSTGVHILITLCCIELFKTPPPISNGIAFVFATIFSYLINSSWTFTKNINKSNFLKFLIVSLIGLLSILSATSVIQLLNIDYMFGLAFVVCIISPIIFALHKKWTFT